jgi:hypothetical protein
MSQRERKDPTTVWIQFFLKTAVVIFSHTLATPFNYTQKLHQRPIEGISSKKNSGIFSGRVLLGAERVLQWGLRYDGMGIHIGSTPTTTASC